MAQSMNEKVAAIIGTEMRGVSPDEALSEVSSLKMMRDNGCENRERTAHGQSVERVVADR